jgi:S-(hydroxymethyl)glutathione dehydrogenase/alcohol dehydrogenase
MRALLYTGEGRMELTQSLSVRDPGPDEVLVRVVASGLCHSDLSVMNGTIKWPAPAVLGHEGAGIVERVGPNVTRFKAGDHVVLHTLANCGRCPACETGHPTHCRGTLGNLSTPFSLGSTPVSNFAATSAFAEVTLVKQEQLVVVDPSVPLDIACLIGCGVLTGVGAVLNRAKVQIGQSAAVFGIGGVGLNVIQGLRIAGASRIIAVDLLPEKKALAEQFGATDFVNPADGDASEQIRALMNKPKAAFDSGGVDWTFECAGSPKALASAVAALDWGGSCVIVGVPPGGAKLELPINFMAYVDRTLMGCRYGSSRPHHDIPLYVDLYRQGRLKLKELVTAHYPIEQYQAAFDDLEHGKLARGVLTF